MAVAVCVTLKLVGEAANVHECVQVDARAQTILNVCGEFVPIAAISLGATAEGHGISFLRDGNPSTWTRFADSTPNGRPATCSFTLDLGDVLCTKGLNDVADVSFDGRKVLFAMRNTFSDDYHLYTLDFETRELKQLTFSERDWLVTFCPEGSLCGTKCGDHPNFGVYWQNAAGERELLAYDPEIECSQPVPLRSRQRVAAARDMPCNPSVSYGTFHVRNVYEGPGLKGVAHGMVKTLRAVALENRPAFIRRGSMYAPHDACFNEFIPYRGDISGEAVAVRGGAWDVKHVLGEVDVAPDGSCVFEVPACNPVYFQLLDGEGRCVQTMRSCATLMPGEYQGCVGCHEAKTKAPPSTIAAARVKAQRLRPAPGQGAHPLLTRLDRGGRLANVANYLGVNAARSVAPDAPTEAFSYPRLVQPVLDRNCVRCHDGTEAKRPNLTGRLTDSYSPIHDGKPADPGRRYSESYLALTSRSQQTPRLNWYSSTGCSAMLPPLAMGSSASAIMDHFKGAHHGVRASDTDRRSSASRRRPPRITTSWRSRSTSRTAGAARMR